MIGLLAEERADRVVLRDPAQDGKLVTVLKRDIDERTDSGPSVMPAGLVNGLASRQQFLDLIRYLREIADGGPERARALRPDPSQVAGLKLPDYERKIDHAGMIADLGPESLERGEAIYNRVCVNCHGTKDKPGSLPTSLRFASGRFKNGSDPYSLYRTLTHGFGQMPPQTWMVPVAEIRRHPLRPRNLPQDATTRRSSPSVDRAYLDRLPKGTTRGPEPSKIEPWSAMDYGPTLTATYEVGDDGSNFAYKGIAVRLDAGPGGVSRGRHWTVFDHDTMRLAASWSGDGFIDWNGINFNGRHEIHPRVVGLVELANPIGPGWANPRDRHVRRPEPTGDATAGPTVRCPDRGPITAASTVMATRSSSRTPSAIPECSKCRAVETGNSSPVFSRTFNIGPRDRAMVLQVARGPKARLRTLASGDGAQARSPSSGQSVGSAPQPPARPPVRFDGQHLPRDS